MAGISFRLLVVVLLCFSQLFFFSNAAPSTRTRSLEHKSQVDGVVPANNHMANAGKKWNMKMMKKMRRMEVRLNDYPGSGPNNRHTPRAQVGRTCVDC